MPPASADASGKGKAQAANDGQNGGNSSDDDDSSSDDNATPVPHIVQAGGGRRKKDALDPGQVTEDMARLALVRKRREEQRLQRIKDEGFDRFLIPGTPGGPPAGWKPS